VVIPTTKFGVGSFSLRYISSRLGLLTPSRLTAIALGKAERLFERLGVGSPLKEKRERERSKVSSNGSIRGIRYRLGLPARGQRTQTNARTPKNRRGGVSNRFSLRNTKVFQSKQQGTSLAIRSSMIHRTPFSIATFSGVPFPSLYTKFFMLAKRGGRRRRFLSRVGSFYKKWVS